MRPGIKHLIPLTKLLFEQPTGFGPENKVSPTVGPHLFQTNPIKILISMSQYIC